MKRKTVQKLDKSRGQSGGVQIVDGVKYAISPLNGAAIPTGGKPGNKGGTGRPADEVRRKLAEIASHKTGFVLDVINGQAMQKMRVPASLIAKHMTCECGELKIAGDDPFVEIEVVASPGVDTRLRAYDTAARYGIGQLKEVSVEHVRERVKQTLEIIRASVEPEKAEQIVGELKAVWT